jgi:hypothetical protein
MTKRITADRPISPSEIAVIQVMLERAAVDPSCQRLAADVERLRVIDRCACGCDSVEFKAHDADRPSTLIADGTGVTPSVGQVGVIIWGTAKTVTGIEVYDLGAGADDIRLPIPSSIRPW